MSTTAPSSASVDAALTAYAKAHPVEAAQGEAWVQAEQARRDAAKAQRTKALEHHTAERCAKAKAADAAVDQAIATSAIATRPVSRSAKANYLAHKLPGVSWRRIYDRLKAHGL